MYIEETGAGDPVGSDPFQDDPVGSGDIGAEPGGAEPGSAGLGGAGLGSAGVGGEDAGIAHRGGSLLLDTPQGVRDVGPATEDTNGNGRPDTAVVDEGADMLLVTDLDGDAAADQTVRIEDTGGVTVSRHTGPGQWTVVEQRGVGQGVPEAAGEPVAPAGSAPGGSTPSGTDDEAWALGEPAAPAPQPDSAQPNPAQPNPAQSDPAQPDPAQPNSGQTATDRAAPEQSAPESPERSAPEQPIPARQPSDAARPDGDAVWA